MGQKIDLVGKRFNRWVVLEEREPPPIKHKRPSYLCKCDCGEERVIIGSTLRNGQSKSCGCFKTDKLSERTKIHGLSKHLLYWVWHGMVNRCVSEKDWAYRRYGGRGIFVCEEWHNDYMSFYMWAISSGYQKGLTIDRINNDGNYEPNNCRWATRKQQQRNRKVSKTHLFFGEQWHLGEIAETFNKNVKRLTDRVCKKWNIYDAVFGKHTKNELLWL